MQNHQIQFRNDLPPPESVNDEVLVAVTQAGICETDLQLARGYMGFAGILGHEFVGVAQSGRLAGQRVVGEINCNCRRCPSCEAGLENHCPQRTVIGIDRHDGAFADYVAVPEHHLHAIPDSVADDEAVFVEPLAAALQICEQVTIGSSDRVAILGDGRLGLLCAQAVGLATSALTVVGKHPDKLARFAALGYKTREHADDVDDDGLYDLVVDCTGSAAGLPLALRLVRPRGTVVLTTTIAGNHETSLAAIVINEITVIGSRCGPFAKAVEAIRDHRIDLSNLITHRFPLHAATEAFAKASEPDAFKVVFEISNH